MIKSLAFACCAAAMFLVWVFPELFFNRQVSFLLWGDYLIDYHSTFLLTSFLYQGGIQLWDFFGQMPHTFFYATHGIFRLPNLLTAFVYWIFSPLAQDSSQFFTQCFAVVQIFSLLLIRTIGLFLLLKQLTSNRWILIVGTAIWSVLFTPPALMIGTFYQSLYPLLLFLLLRFFQSFNSRYLGLAAVFMIVSFSQGFVHTAYLYLGVHFFIISCLTWVAFYRRQDALLWLKGIGSAKAQWLGGMGIIALLAAAVLGPYLHIQLFGLKDFELGLQDSRVADMWSWRYYFQNMKVDSIPPHDFLRRMLDFNAPIYVSFFLGYAMLFLSAVAVCFSKDNRKWIFGASLLWIWLINFQPSVLSVGTVGHIVNFLTNPLKTMVRSYHMASLSVLPYFFIPLAVLGILTLIDLFQGGVPPAKWRQRWLVCVGGLATFVFANLNFVTAPVQIYWVVALFVSLWGLDLLLFHPNARSGLKVIAAVLFLILGVADALLSTKAMKRTLAEFFMRPYVINFYPHKGQLGLDYQNPKMFPFVERADIHPMERDSFLWTLREISPGFNRVINRELMFIPIDAHNPRHQSVKDWVSNPIMKNYLSARSELFFFAKYAVADTGKTFEDIVQQGRTHDVIMVAQEGLALPHAIPSRSATSPSSPPHWNTKDYTLKSGLNILDLPDNFPRHLATTVLTEDSGVSFALASGNLDPAQGWIIKPLSFDVKNIKEDKLVVALPQSARYEEVRGRLSFQMAQDVGLKSVWRHQNDAQGFNFYAWEQGWLVIQYPYDPKWKVTMDGKPVQFYRSNRSFIGFPISEGEHKILIEYWPGSWLRYGLFISALVALLAWMFLIVDALRREPRL